MSEWFYARDDERKGPVTAAELRTLADRGFLSPDDLVWRPGFTDWVAAGDVAELGLPAPHPTTARDDDNWDDRWPRYPERRRRSTRQTAIMAVAFVLLGVLVVGGIACAFLFIGRPDQRFVVDVPANQSHKRVLEFEAGTDVTITVHSDIDHPMTDVDLYVVEVDTGMIVMRDEEPDENCEVRFHVPKSQKYEIELRNLGPGSARCTVSCRVSKPN
jgi:hypothetical protein